VRYNAANSLAFDFQHRAARDKLLRMLAQDSDAGCRRVAAGGIGNLFQDTKERGVLDALANAALNDADEYVRASAYKALQIVSGVSRDEHLCLLRSQDLVRC
jgi:HEAT repeat protein